MTKDKQQLRKIYDRTDGYCHICRKKLSFKNYGKNGLKGAWHKDHSVPRSKGGADHMNNYFAACIKCNIEKGTISSRTMRNAYGNTRAPLSKEKKKEIREQSTSAGAIIGGILGAPAGPWGIAVGATIGGIIGNSSSPDV